MLEAVTALKTTTRNAAVFVSIIISIGTTMMWRAGDRAIQLADKVVSVSTDIEISKQDRRVIHEELKLLSQRIDKLEVACHR